MLQFKGLRTAELHDALCQALLDAGASPPEPLLPDGYNDDKADAVFVEDRTIIEVKMVSKDHSAANEITRRLAPVIAKYGRPPGPFSEWPRKVRQAFESKIAPRILKDLRDANRQVRETEAALGWPTSYGVVAFALPNCFQVDPGIIGWEAKRLMLERRTKETPHLHAILVIAAPVDDQPWQGPPVFASLLRKDGRPLPNGLFDRINEAWRRHLEARTGVTYRRVDGSHDDFMDRYLSE